jgi:hypothetical protein
MNIKIQWPGGNCIGIGNGNSAAMTLAVYFKLGRGLEGFLAARTSTLAGTHVVKPWRYAIPLWKSRTCWHRLHIRHSPEAAK